MTATPDDRDRAEAAQVEAQLWAARSEVQRMTILSRALAAARRDGEEQHAALREVARAANVMLLELGASKLRFTNGEVVSFRDAKVTFGPKTSAVVDALAALEAAHPGVLAREG